MNVHSQLDNLHAEEGKDEDEEEEEEEQGEDGPHRVEQRDDQVAKACPVLRHLDVVGNHRMFCNSLVSP